MLSSVSLECALFPGSGGLLCGKGRDAHQKVKIKPWRKPFWAWLTPRRKKEEEVSDSKNENRYTCIDRDLMVITAEVVLHVKPTLTFLFTTFRQTAKKWRFVSLRYEWNSSFYKTHIFFSKQRRRLCAWMYSPFAKIHHAEQSRTVYTKEAARSKRWRG